MVSAFRSQLGTRERLVFEAQARTKENAAGPELQARVE